MRILGIDPGYGIVGYSVLDYEKNNFKLVTSGAITTIPNTPFNDRIVHIYDSMCQIIEMFKPEAMAIEDLFFNNNIKTGIKVAQARGILILAAMKHDVPVYEYTPLQVKQGVVGYGRATKQQVKKMVQYILKQEKIPKLDDVTDAIAIAICHAHTGNANALLSKYL